MNTPSLRLHTKNAPENIFTVHDFLILLSFFCTYLRRQTEIAEVATSENTSTSLCLFKFQLWFEGLQCATRENANFLLHYTVFCNVCHTSIEQLSLSLETSRFFVSPYMNRFLSGLISVTCCLLKRKKNAILAISMKIPQSWRICSDRYEFHCKKYITAHCCQWGCCKSGPGWIEHFLD